MIRVWIDYSDGAYRMRELRADEQPKESDVIVPLHVWRAYQAFKDQAKLWNDILAAYDPHR